MKIVFWSEEKDCGTTSNMLAAATMTALRYAYRILLISADKSVCDFMTNYTKKDKTIVREDCAYYVLDGMDYLLTAAKYGKLTADHIEEAVKTIIKGRLFCLPQGARLLCDYYPNETKRALDQVIGLSEQTMDLVFIDCGTDGGEWTKEQMKQADLVVVNFKHSPHSLTHFFTDQKNISKKMIYFIGSYQKESVYNKKNIHRIYRIEPEKLGVIPYNPEFEFVCREGKLDKYMKGKRNLPVTGMRQYFFEELERAVQILIQNLDDSAK